MRCIGPASAGRRTFCSPAEGEQRERYLLPAVRGERAECLAMTEPGAGSDLRGMKTSAVASGGDFVINGTKHFISHADHSDFVILFAASGEEATSRGPRKKITAFLIDMGHPGFEVRAGYKNVSHRGYTNSILEFNNCRVPKSASLGRGSPRVRGGEQLAGCHPSAGRRDLPGTRRARAGAAPSSGPWIACNSGSKSASSRA